jgi:2-phosphosulfolactate phosphatase
MSETARPAVFVHLLPPLIPPGALNGGVALVVDVLRATTVMVRALASGCEAIIPCGEIGEAKSIAASLPAGTALLAGEREGLPIPGFDLGNSPDDFTPDVCRGKTLVMTTTNGTRAILASREAERVGIAAMSNVIAATRWAGSSGRDVHVVCAGTDGHVSLEDTLLAGEIVHRLRRSDGYTHGNDSALIAHGFFSDMVRIARDKQVPWADLIAWGRGGRRVREIGLQKDIEAAGLRETSDVVPLLECDPLRVVARGRAGGE